MNITFPLDPAYPQATLSACENQLRLFAALFSAAGRDLELNDQALCALMDQLLAMADAVAAVERHFRGPGCAKAA